MTESTEATPQIEAAPQKLCEKCRHTYPLDHFALDLEGLECVCRRCLQVMGYRPKGGQ